MSSKRTFPLPGAIATALLLVFSASFAFKPPKPTPLTPVNGSTGQDTDRVIFKWDTAKYAVSYTLDMSTDSSHWVSVAGFPHTHSAGVTDTMDSTGGFVSSTEYFWRVNAFSVDSVSDWSSTFNFTTVIMAPMAPVPATPSNNATSIATNPTLTWNAAQGAASYHLQVSIDPRFGSTFADYPALTATSQPLSGLDMGRTYYWRVSATNTNGTSPWSQVFRFYTTPESYASWSFHKNLYINTKASGGGAGVQNRVYNFPLLVRLNPNIFGWFGQTLNGGADIRFAKSNGTTPLPYEIERWVDVTGNLDTAEIWVRLDTVNSLDSTQSIVMYWGNAGATSRSDPYGTFDTSSGFAAVWHMNETPSGTDVIKDRTLTGCNGTPTPGGVTSGAGPIGKALSFDGSTGYLTMDSMTTDFGSAITVSCWVNYFNFVYNSHILDFGGTNLSADNFFLGNLTATSTLRWNFGSPPLDNPSYFLTDTSTYVTAVYSNAGSGQMTVYKDGAPFGSPLVGVTPVDHGVTWLSNYIAYSNDRFPWFFNGQIDEVEISKIARDSNWIKLAFQTQRSNQTALCYPPSVAQSPHDTSVQLNDTARFSAVARGNDVQYKWMRSNDSVTYTLIAGATGSQYKFVTSGTPAPGDTSPLVKNYPRFKCIAFTPYYSDTSAAATLTVCVPTAIKTGGDPSSETVFLGDPAQFSVSAAGRSLTYLWQRSDNGGAWGTAPGTATNITYTFTTASADTSARFRCIVTSTTMCNNSATSQAAGLTLCNHITISQQPHDTSGVTAGTSARFTVVASGGRYAVSYQWKSKKQSDTGWTILSGSGANTATYTLISAATSDSGKLFKCFLSNSPCESGDTTRSALLGVCTPAAIDSNPGNTNVNVGQPASFHVVAHGSGIKYLWQRSNDTGHTWVSAPSGLSGDTNAVYSFTTAATDTGMAVEFRCQVTAACGSSAISAPARVGVCFPAAITGNPRDTGVLSGQPVFFQVTATGTNLTYQWQRSNNGGTTWSPISGATGSSWAITPAPADSGSQFRCVATATCGAATSAAALLRVWTPVAIADSTYPRNDTATGGSLTSFSITLTGNGSSAPSYQWWRSTDSINWTQINASTPVIGHKSGWNLPTFTLSQTDTVDTNAFFRCVVTAYYGSAQSTITSRGARLSLCYNPAFDASGQTQQIPSGTVSPNSSVSFSVTPKTIGRPSYQWEQSSTGGPPYFPISGQNASSYTINSVPSNYDGYKFLCKVYGGPCPGDTITSNPVTLRVCTSPNIVTQPASPQNAIENNSAGFSISAVGTNISCRWQKRVKTTANWDKDTLQNNTNQTLNLPPVKLTDDSTCFRCLVTGSCGACTSSVAVLHVFMKAHAIFNMSNYSYGPWSRSLSGPGPDSLWFLDSSYGHINQCVLHFGDGTVTPPFSPRPSDTSPPNLPQQHIYPAVTKLTTYICTLVVRDTNMPANCDTMKNTVVIYSDSAGTNPLVISGRYLDSINPGSLRAELLLTNYSTLKDTGSFGVSNNGIKVWYRSGFIPPAPIPGSFNASAQEKSYNLDSMNLPRYGGLYIDTVTVARDTGYCFLTQIHWNIIPADSTPLDAVNGCYVLMRDTTRPANNLVISKSAYGTSKTSPWDTVYFRFDSTQKIDTVASDSVALWFGLGSDSNPNFSRSNPNTRWWGDTLVINGAVPATKRFTYADVDSLQFNCQTTWLYCAVLLHGRNKLTSPLVSYKFQIGRPRPANPIYLSAPVDSNANSIHLTWTWDTTAVRKDSAQGMRIYYRANSAVPDTFQFDTTIFTEVKPDPGVNDIETYANGLKGSTHYFFGAQILSNNGLWSSVTGGSSADAVTGDSTKTSVRNTIRINTPIVFDTATNSIKVSWHVDRMGYTNLSLGISFFLRTAVPKATILAGLKSTDFTGIPISPIKINSNDTGSYSISLDTINLLYPGSLVFDTTYYVFLWLDKANSPWSKPTDSSTATCYVPPFVSQLTRWNFADTADTSYWANGNVRYTVPGGNPGGGTWEAKIHVFTPDTATHSLNGFIGAGQGIRFMDEQNSDPFFIGLKCVPGGYSMKNARIYRYDTITGKWQVMRNTILDTVHSYAAVSDTPTASSPYGNLVAPFAVMVDTEPPKITWIDAGDTAPKLKLIAVHDTLQANDNVENLAWHFFSERGENALSLQDSATVTNGSAAVTTVINPQFVNDQNGARAQFIADDGRFYDTVDMSRRVYRDTNIFYSTAMSWVPLWVTATLDSPSMKRLWRFVASANGTYDNRYVRVFRFYPDAANAGSALNQKWVEFGQRPDSVFDIVPGRLFWVKTRDQVICTLGRGTTMPLNKMDTINLNPLGWTDFALPFEFSMRIGDIISANDDSTTQYFLQLIEGLQFYYWPSSGTNRCQRLYNVGWPTYDSLSSLMSYKVGYTVFNPNPQGVRLLIPPRPITMSAYNGSSPVPKRAAGSWMARLVPKTDKGVLLTEVFCGYDASGASKLTSYPMPPSFGKLSVAVCEEQTGALNDTRILHTLRNGGCSYLLSFINDTSCARTISFKLERLTGFTTKMKTVLYDQSTGVATDLTGATQVTIAVDGQTSAYRWLLVGDDSYIATARKSLPVLKLALDRVYPNPVRSMVRLRYTVPFALNKVDFTIFDISGRTVWNKTMEEQSPVGGSRECQWSVSTNSGRRVAAGVYIVRMAAYNQKGKMVGSFNQLLTVLR